MNNPKILDGRCVANEIYKLLPDMNGKELSIITIGDDYASEKYVNSKIKAGNKINLKGVNYRFTNKGFIDNELGINLENNPHVIPTDSSVATLIKKLNKDPNVAGIMVQKPYPPQFKGIENLVSLGKDVDGLNIENLGLTCMGETPSYYPATPEGIMLLLDYYKIPMEGKNVVIIGRSDIVGKPLAAMMTARNATVTLCHSKTLKRNLEWNLQNADIIISAVGKPKFINHKFFTDDSGGFVFSNYPVIIDVGINRDENGKLCGDVDFDDVLPYVSAITPVPGGVGLITVASLILHCCGQWVVDKVKNIFKH